MGRTFLRVAGTYPCTLASDDVPHPDGAVVASRHRRAPPCNESTDRGIMAYKVQLMVRVFAPITLDDVE